MGMFKSFKNSLVLISLASSIALCPLASGFSIPWKQKASFQFAKEITLSELIRGYFALQDVTVVIDKDVVGTVNGEFEDLSPEEFLNRLSRAYALTWWYDGNVVYVDPAQKVQSQLLNITSHASKKLLETVSSLGIVAPSSSIRLVGTSGIAFVSGPPKYIELVANITKQLNSILDTKFNETLTVKIFPLQHAWAYDTSFSTQETRITLPGLANVLRGLMETGTMVTPEMIVSGQVNMDRIQVANKITTFNQANQLLPYHNKEILPVNDRDPAILPPVAPEIVSQSATLIQPDIRLNAIIVRDVEAKMPQYQAIIDALDVPVYLIEISVAIVDVDTKFSSDIGNQFFSATKGSTDISFNTTGLTGTTPPTTGFNFKLGAVWDGYQIISQIQALATEGYANILARPTVLTLNNLEARISRSTTFYVPLIGSDASDLANVTVGTILKVTPRVVEEKDGYKRIQLFIDLNDGAADTTSITTDAPYPITSDNTINTQAVLYEGQSLFIGGYYRQEKGASESGIPILKDLPFIGYAFKVKRHANTTFERMYLITPRIVNIDFARAPDITDQICDFTPPPMGIADQMARRDWQCEHPGCPPYAADLDCCRHPSAGCYRRPANMYTKIHRYFE